MALTKDGFKRKTYEDLVNDLSLKAKESFGEDTNVSDRSIMGLLIRIMAWILSLLWQDTEDVYYSAYRKTAEGVQLDMLLPYAGITRNPAEFSYGEVTVKGQTNYTLPSGFIIATKKDVFFETIKDVTLDKNGEGIVEIIAMEAGTIGNVEAGSITEIVNPDGIIESVINLKATTEGKGKETDTEARKRANLTTDGIGSGTTASIRTNILKVAGVRAVRVIENYSNETDSFGTPMRSIQAFVLGGQDQDIANAIFDKKSGGIQPYGNIYVDVIDTSGNTKKVGFSRATEVDIYVKVNANTNSEFQSNGEAQIISSIVQYIGGVDSDLSTYAGLNMGDNVILVQTIARVLNVTGVTDTSIMLSIDRVNYDENNIIIGQSEVAQVNAVNIEVKLNV